MDDKTRKAAEAIFGEADRQRVAWDDGRVLDLEAQVRLLTKERDTYRELYENTLETLRKCVAMAEESEL